MKQQEQKRLLKIVEELKKIHEVLLQEKVKRALRNVGSLVEKLEKKASGKVSKKRPATGFAKFVKDHSAEVKKANPDATAPERMKLLAALYREEKEEGRGRGRTKSASSSRSSSRSPSPKPKARKPRAKKD
jgi:hypothetical protein